MGTDSFFIFFQKIVDKVIPSGHPSWAVTIRIFFVKMLHYLLHRILVSLPYSRLSDKPVHSRLVTGMKECIRRRARYRLHPRNQRICFPDLRLIIDIGIIGKFLCLVDTARQKYLVFVAGIFTVIIKFRKIGVVGIIGIGCPVGDLHNPFPVFLGLFLIKTCQLFCLFCHALLLKIRRISKFCPGQSITIQPTVSGILHSGIGFQIDWIRIIRHKFYDQVGFICGTKGRNIPQIASAHAAGLIIIREKDAESDH